MMRRIMSTTEYRIDVCTENGLIVVVSHDEGGLMIRDNTRGGADVAFDEIPELIEALQEIQDKLDEDELCST